MDPVVLIIILFVVAPLLERLFKAGKGDQKLPPGQRPGQPPGQWPAPPQRRMPEQRPHSGEPRPGEGPVGQGQTGARAEQETAAGMLPDDLWEILTGERRLPPPTRPPADEEYEPEFDDEIDDEILAEELRQEELRSAQAESASWRRGEPAPWEEEPAQAAPRPPARPLPAPVKARQTPMGRPAERAPHVREMPVFEAPQIVSLEALSFDDELRHDQFHERLEGLAPAARVRRRPGLLAAEQFSNDDLRRAIIMAEVLGTPKGLD